MKEKNNIILLFVVLAVGGAALWYLRSLPTAEAPTVVGSTTAATDVVATSTDDVDTVPREISKEPTKTESSVSAQSGLDADVAAISELSDAEYDDAALDSVFTNEGVNMLVDSYEI